MTDNYETLTGVSHGYNAFQSCSIADGTDRKHSAFASKQAIMTAARSRQQSELIENLRAAGVAVGVLRGLSKKSDELVRARQEREEAITGKKKVSRFNVQIASADDTRRTRAIAGRN